MKTRFFSGKPRLVFFLCYTLLFVLAVQAAAFVLPFVLSLFTAVLMKPLYDYLRIKFSFRSSFAATALTLLVFGVVFAVIGIILFLAISQALSLLEDYRGVITDLFRSPALFDTLKETVISGNLLNTVTSVASVLFHAVPLGITFVIVTFALTVFFLHHLGDLRDNLLHRAGEYSNVLGNVMHIAGDTLRRLIRSYLILYAITFAEAVFIFYVTGVEYPIAFAFVTAVADVLPILGPGTVYVPFAIVFILQKNYISGVILLVFFLLTVVLRQILEPRIVSDQVKVHPLVVLSAIYFSIVSMNIWVLFYVVSIFIAYRILDTAHVFDTDLK
ncbi:AI-2E family transporter [uncultured Ruminococcus sp.]|uniref:AI-2E family transporter n=1 Tax=uncultured Ruminococcus sp. TaxID=165186 RepID=UPI002930E57F|nr:AI-2E family transporter [uncultured Ruminococcus sp.]